MFDSCAAYSHTILLCLSIDEHFCRDCPQLLHMYRGLWLAVGIVIGNVRTFRNSFQPVLHFSDHIPLHVPFTKKFVCNSETMVYKYSLQSLLQSCTVKFSLQCTCILLITCINWHLSSGSSISMVITYLLAVHADTQTHMFLS